LKFELSGFFNQSSTFDGISRRFLRSHPHKQNRIRNAAFLISHNGMQKAAAFGIANKRRESTAQAYTKNSFAVEKRACSKKNRAHLMKSQ